MLKTLTCSLLFLVLLGINSCSADKSNKPDQRKVPITQSLEYQILAVEDTSFRGRVRKRVRIYAPHATTFVTRSETALQAAVDAQEKWNADAIGIFLVRSKNETLQERAYPLAIANYSPDAGGWSGSDPFRNGTWEAEASDVILRDQDIKIAELWYEKRNSFQVDDGYGGFETDEDALAESIAREMDISIAQVSLLPLVEIITSRKPYQVD